MTSAPATESPRSRPWWGSPAALSVALVLLGLAMWLDPWRGFALEANIPPVDPSFIDKHPRRTVGDAMVTRDDSSACSDCHEEDEDPTDPGTKFEETHEIQLKHGMNDHCFNCHDPKKRDLLLIRNGGTIEFKDVNLVCASCHGNTYRDYEHGAHGRRQGYYDQSKGTQTAARCIECHDPHNPKISGLKPAPGPHLLHESRIPE